MSENLRTSNVRTLVDILNKEHAYYKDMLELAKAKKRLIVENKVAELDKVVKLEQNMIFDIGQLEKAREAEVWKLCASLGIRREQSSLTELIKRLGEDDKQQFETLRTDLADILNVLKAENDQNGVLIKQSLEYIDYSINVISSAGTATSSLYEDLDQKAKNNITKKRLFDTKI